jgi:hypothetical protein
MMACLSGSILTVVVCYLSLFCHHPCIFTGKGGKNVKKGKKRDEGERRDLIFKEDGQGK